MTLAQLAYLSIFGKPLIFYLGILTYFSFLSTASVPIINKKTKYKIPFSWHMRLAIASLTLATIHGLLGILTYL